MPKFTAQHFEQLINPRSVIIAGASDKTGPGSYNLMENLINEGIDKRIYPVNLRADTVLGQKAYQRIRDIPEIADMALIMVPRAAVAEAVLDCVEKGIKIAVIVSQGFADADSEGCELQDQLVKIVKGSDTRLIGPNTIGIANSFDYFHTSFQKFDLYQKHNALICQSGMMVLASADFTTGLGLGVDIGNGADVSFNDLLPHLGEDDRIKVINLHIEGLVDGAAFTEIAATITPRKPILGFKVGRSEAGAKAAASHSGALVGEEHVIDAAFEKAGVMRVASLQEMSDLNKALLTWPGIRGKRIAVISISGGGGIMVVDALGEHGLELATPSQGILDEIQKLNPPWLKIANPVDSWMAVLKKGLADANVDILRQLLADDQVDGAIVLLNAYRTTGLDALRDWIDGIVQAQKDFIDKPVALWAFGENQHEVIEKAEESGIVAGFNNPGSAARALAELYRYHHEIKDRALDEAVTPDGIDQAVAEKILTRAREEKIQVLAAETFGILEAYGIKSALSRLASNREELMTVADDLGYPLAIKISSEQIIHKTDVGGIRLNLTNEQELLGAFEEMYEEVKQRAPKAVLDGVQVQRFIGVGVETIIGATRHEGFGPVIVFGLGGIHAEFLKDVTFALAPVSISWARAMIGKIKADALLDGARGTDPIDKDELAQVIVRVSKLMIDFPQIEELDINPYTIAAAGGVALDTRAILAHG